MNLAATISGPDTKGIFTATVINGSKRSWHKLFADDTAELRLRLRQNQIDEQKHLGRQVTHLGN